MLKKLLLTALIPAALFAQNQALSLNLNSTDLEASYELNKPAGGTSRIYYGIEALDGEDEFEKGHVMISGHFSIVGLTPLPGLAAGIGFKGLSTAIEAGDKDYTVLALPIKIGAIYTLPLVVKSHVSAFIAYAPESLCISDCNRYSETRLEAAIEPMEGGMIVVGWRNLQLKIEEDSDSYEFNRATYLGIRLMF